MSAHPTESEATEKVTFPDPSLYSLTRDNSRRALEAGLAEADWYQCPVPRSKMRELLVRRNGPAIRDTLLWLGVIAAAAAATTALWGSWWALFPYLIYAALYGGSADSRWHETLHGTAFKSDWMNRALYELASFMVLRESTIWRWSHTRHHSDTIIVGRDPEIAAPRPPDLVGMFLGVFAIRSYPQYFQSLFRHAFGKMSEAEREFVPEEEFPGVFRTARIHLAIYLGVIILALALQSWLPLFFVGFPNFFGRWLMILFGLTQHTGLAEDVLDHRLNSRTFLTNRLNRFLYWNMNYHIEHHIYPLVPYHALPELHELVKADCPPPYPSLFSCWREIIPTLIQQTRDPSYHIRRVLPESAGKMTGQNTTEAVPDDEGWLRVCAASDLQAAEARRFDHREQTYAIYRDGEGSLFATDGICTHGRTHLSEGLVIEKMIECPKHNGRFNLEDGSPARKPVCRALQTYEIIEKEGGIFLRLPGPD